MPMGKKPNKFPPQSCDTFVVLPPSTTKGCIIFGKNSDRPAGEVQEVIYVFAADHPSGSKLQCTYIEIEQVDRTYAAILSKPSWMWGAEMGANEHGVCIGNEAVMTKLNGADDEKEKLLGMDLVRLGLERSSTAHQAVEVIGSLLEQYGQGGHCSDTNPSLIYHNSFLIADRKEAWVLETAGNLWAAEQIIDGVRNISNCLSVGTKIDLMCDNLKEEAQSKGLWDPSQGDLDFAKVFGENNENARHRYNCGRELLLKLSASGDFDTLAMFEVLRDKESGICRGKDHEHPTASSQVSVLSPLDSSRPCCHWFTGTPDTRHSVFKPFVFCSNARVSPHIISPVFPDNEDPAKIKPRFQGTVDRRHALYKYHEKAYSLMTGDSPKGKELKNTMHQLETSCIQEMEQFLDGFSLENTKDAEDLFKDLVESEMKFYK